MKLKIKEFAWGINRISGEYRKKITNTKTIVCNSCDTFEFGKGKRLFSVDEINECSIVFSVHSANARFNKTWKIKKGEKICYRPFSFDGGYFYYFELK